METINLFGASGHAKVVMDIVQASGRNVGCLYDDAPHCDSIHGITVFKADDVEVEGPMVISIGSNRVRKLISERYTMPSPTVVHPSAIVSPTAKIGEGTVVMHGAIIQSDANIGRHCIINTGATVDHECVIGDYVHISPNASLCGNVHVDEGVHIGAGVTIIPNIHIGAWATVGAGAVVISNIPAGCVAVGVPAKIIKNEQ